MAIASQVSRETTGADVHTESGKSFERLKQQLQDHSPSAALLVAAHRGQWREAPENSLAAIDEAINDGAEIVEVDVQLTKDGVPVLMHDANLVRTTNGTGKLSSMTLSELKSLQLRETHGGAKAPITRHSIPTLEEAMNTAKNRAMVNLDNGWPIRDEILSVLESTGTVDHGIFKGSPTVRSAEEFMARDSNIQYMQVVSDATAWKAFAFEGRQPVAVEVLFDSLTDPQAQPEYLNRLGAQGRVWINAISNSLSAGNTDDASIRLDGERGWDNLVSKYGANIIQTDNVEAIDYWRKGGSLRLWDKQNHAGGVHSEDENVLE
ncbi:glycerophosphodiester phosphodiesterase family protein [Paeniglutamicibacter gangotriensis]|uniref:glycerophosphodiester phosphodiesterase family protein n=1 Tax=Paeniglutamicibacter gangotriensis TaxID=254787 RepID=UPI0037CCBBDF